MTSEHHQQGKSAESIRSMDAPPQLPDEVDVSLIRWMLSLTPTERLEVLQNHIKALSALKAAADAG